MFRANWNGVITTRTGEAVVKAARTGTTAFGAMALVLDDVLKRLSIEDLQAHPYQAAVTGVLSVLKLPPELARQATADQEKADRDVRRKQEAAIEEMVRKKSKDVIVDKDGIIQVDEEPRNGKGT